MSGLPSCQAERPSFCGVHDITAFPGQLANQSKPSAGSSGRATASRQLMRAVTESDVLIKNRRHDSNPWNTRSYEVSQTLLH
eukprot:859858-Amphidinium_carterae.1